ncbi:MAG TPA: hypothetical protein EYQ74_14445 [Planctomycetes bacterium]|nr:hypothetical protein [Planctomycetota bacterium]HIK62162.1 hypothetical protein [Planctomycetota bacterium]
MLAIQRRLFCLLLASLLLPCYLQAACLQDGAKPTEADPPGEGLFSRVVVIGASVSAGYGLRSELNASVRLGDVLQCLIEGEGEECLDLGSNMLFRRPEALGAEQVTDALMHKPSLVMAVDFLFWFAYGRSNASTRKRVDRIDEALSLLDRFECPILVGDIPDMTMALKGKGPFGFPLITRSMIPSKQARAAINKRLLAWAKARKRVTIVPLSEFLESVQSGKTLKVRGNKWTQKDLAAMMQDDLLHTRPQGSLSLLTLALDRLCLKQEGASNQICWDRDLAYKRLLESTLEERSRYEAAVKAREERKAKRDKDRQDD